MKGPGVLLIESLDPVGSSADDARARLAALHDAGFSAHALVVAGPSARSGAGGSVQWVADAAGLRDAARAALARARFSVALVASGAPPVALARSLPPGLDMRWWPTALGAGASPHGSSGDRAAPDAPRALMLDALEGAIVDPPRGRQGAPLWDGDYVLAPIPLAPHAGREIFEAFARAARGRSGLEMVVLADPDPELERIARALGVGVRVHFAGEAPGPAAVSWFRAAAAVVLPAAASLAATLVLRVLDSGAPAIVAGPGAPADALRRWLAAQGCAAGGEGVGLSGALERALVRGADVVSAIARAREVAERHRPAAMKGRLREWLPERAEPGGRIAA
ncbi:MAG TPA: hypothetical protein VGK89_03500 [Candidatus Eisenbacteria bacterium]|jgi:hypothetical protein